MKNSVQLITYVDRFGGSNISALKELLTGKLQGLFPSVHLLPFFYPIDGADAGFDPINHNLVDPRLGDWECIKSLSQEVDVMADLIVNHISADSKQFREVQELGEKSTYNSLFLCYADIFPDGATQDELLKIYRPRPGFPFTRYKISEEKDRLFWTTFTPKQIDINIQTPSGREYLKGILQQFQEAGISMIRMDAVGYAVKTAGSSCFMTPETYEFIEELSKEASALGIEVLVEIHSYFRQQIAIAKKVDWVYDFALPPLILHTIFKRDTTGLKKWLEISPRNAVTVLDTHDGIGIVDIGAGSEPGEEEGLISPEDIDALVETIHENSGGNSRKATGAAASNLDLYQVNCTFYDALGRRDDEYLIARMIQFFSPGIPQVYYMGFLAGENDMELLAKTQVGRDINRHYYSREELEQALEKPAVKSLCQLIRLRNEHPAFAGTFTLHESEEHVLELSWTHGSAYAACKIDFNSLTFTLSYTRKDGSLVKKNSLDQDLTHSVL